MNTQLCKSSILREKLSLTMHLLYNSSGQCVLPLQWKEMFAPYAGQVQLWGDRPLTPTSVDSWELWMFANDNLLIDTQSGSMYSNMYIINRWTSM